MLLTNSCFELVWLGAVIVSISCLALWIHLATLNIYTELRFIQMKTDFWLEWRFISLKLTSCTSCSHKVSIFHHLLHFVNKKKNEHFCASHKITERPSSFCVITVLYHCQSVGLSPTLYNLAYCWVILIWS